MDYTFSDGRFMRTIIGAAIVSLNTVELFEWNIVNG